MNMISNKNLLYYTIASSLLASPLIKVEAQSNLSPSPSSSPNRLELIGDVGRNLDEHVLNTPLPINNNGMFVYSVSAYNDSSAGYLIFDTKRKSLEMEIDVGAQTETPIIESLNFLWKKIFRFDKHALFYNIDDSTHVQEVDKGKDDEEIVTYAFKDNSAVVINYKGNKKIKKGEVLPGEPLVDLLYKKFTGQEIPYERLKTFVLGLKYEITVTYEEIRPGFEKLVLDPKKSRLWENGKWVPFVNDKDVIFESAKAYFVEGVLVLAEANVNKSIFSTQLRIELVTDQKTLSKVLHNR